MLSSVSLSGRLGEALADNVRYVELDRVLSTSEGGSYKIDKIPVRSYGGRLSRFMSAKKGTLILLKGRLETNEKLGVIVIAEFHEIYSAIC